MFEKNDFQVSSEKRNYLTDVELPGKLFWGNTRYLVHSIF